MHVLCKAVPIRQSGNKAKENHQARDIVVKQRRLYLFLLGDRIILCLSQFYENFAQ